MYAAKAGMGGEVQHLPSHEWSIYMVGNRRQIKQY
jgi:hypothetical protein